MRKRWLQFLSARDLVLCFILIFLLMQFVFLGWKQPVSCSEPWFFTCFQRKNLCNDRNNTVKYTVLLQSLHNFYGWHNNWWKLHLNDFWQVGSTNIVLVKMTFPENFHCGWVADKFPPSAKCHGQLWNWTMTKKPNLRLSLFLDLMCSI